MTDGDRYRTSAPPDSDGDALGRLIRAAGRRPVPSAADYERVRLASHLAWQMKVHARRRRRSLWWATAASIVAAAIGALATWPWASPPPVAELAMLRGRVERFVANESRWEPLASGAEIAAGARLRTPPDGAAVFYVAGGIALRVRGATDWVFDAATRVTLESGTLYVDAGEAGDRVRKLEVVTAHGVVQHLGTQYEVRALSSELRLRVREGRVQVSTPAAAVRYEAPAGEELLLTPGGAVERRPIAADSPEWRWAEALASATVELDGGSAYDALKWVARETGKRLIFEDANTELVARNAIIHGSSTGLEPLQVLEVVMATSVGLDYTLGAATLVVRRR